MNIFKFRFTFFLFSTIGVYSIFMSFLFNVQQKIIFRPEPLPQEYKYDFNIPFQEFNLTHKNGERINTLYFPSEEKKGLILYFHGNSKNLQHWGKYLSDITGRGYDIVAIDYRGYGKSDGKPSEENMYEDAMLLHQWARTNFPDKEPIIWGRSLGTAIASQLSTKVAAKKLILETPFYNIPELIHTRFPYLIIPVEMRYQFPNNLHLADNCIQTYIIQGTKDSIVPLKSASKLREILESDDYFFVIKGAGHKNLHEFNDYQSILDNILRTEDSAE